MSNYYILQGKRAVIANLGAWAEWFDKNNDQRIVKQDTLPNGMWVSTVFLGLDHSFGNGKPLLFETMVFPKKGDFSEVDMDRYTTYLQAEKGHANMVKKYGK